MILVFFLIIVEFGYSKFKEMKRKYVRMRRQDATNKRNKDIMNVIGNSLPI